MVVLIKSCFAFRTRLNITELIIHVIDAQALTGSSKYSEFPQLTSPIETRLSFDLSEFFSHAIMYK